jgi:hypothetical protein
LPQVVARFAIPPHRGSDASFGRCAELLDCRHQSRSTPEAYTVVVSRVKGDAANACVAEAPQRSSFIESLANGFANGFAAHSASVSPEYVTLERSRYALPRAVIACRAPSGADAFSITSSTVVPVFSRAPLPAGG